MGAFKFARRRESLPSLRPRICSPLRACRYQSRMDSHAYPVHPSCSRNYFGLNAKERS